jgi:hypothetical protein
VRINSGFSLWVVRVAGNHAFYELVLYIPGQFDERVGTDLLFY